MDIVTADAGVVGVEELKCLGGGDTDKGTEDEEEELKRCGLKN